MIQSIRARLVLLLALGFLAVVLNFVVSYLVADRQIKVIMKNDVTTIADSLEKSISYIAAIRPEAYREQDFKQYIYNLKLGKTGYVYLLDANGVLAIHSKDEGKSLAGQPHIDLIRSHRESGYCEYRSVTTGQDKVAAYRYIKPWGLWLVPGLNKSDYFDQLRTNFLRYNLPSTLLIIMLMVAFGVRIIRNISVPLSRLTEAAGRISSGELDEQIPVTRDDEIGSLTKAINQMTMVIVKNYRIELEKSGRLYNSIRSAIQKLVSAVRNMGDYQVQQSVGAFQQSEAVQIVATVAEGIATTAKQIEFNSRAVEFVAENTSKSCRTGSDDVRTAANGMAELRRQMQNVAGSMRQLGEHSEKIGGVVEIIDEISVQTNLLSLNAAIEAAGAGEYGKRFSIVADEVRRLAEGTILATRQIKTLVEEIQKSTNSTLLVAELGAQAVDQVTSQVEKVEKSFSEILALSNDTVAAVRTISQSTRNQTSSCERMADTMLDMRDVAQLVADGAHQTELAIGELTALADELKGLMEVEIEVKGKVAAAEGAARLGEILERALAEGRCTLEDMFDENYVPIPDTDPPKYHTRYDACFDELIQDFEDAYLQDEQVVYAVLADRNGYVPTHHRKNSLPLTGDQSKDRVGNRTKRIFNRQEELAAVRNTSGVLVQFYFWDTREKIWDISAPVYVKGRHWGAFRIGYIV